MFCFLTIWPFGMVPERIQSACLLVVLGLAGSLYCTLQVPLRQVNTHSFQLLCALDTSADPIISGFSTFDWWGLVISPPGYPVDCLLYSDCFWRIVD